MSRPYAWIGLALLSLGLLLTPGVLAQAAQAEAIAKAIKDAEPLYEKFCVGCHGSKGEGGAGAKFVGNPTLKDNRTVIVQILGGSTVMPGFRDNLKDAEIAALATLVRNSWGNTFGVVTEAEVKAIR